MSAAKVADEAEVGQQEKPVRAIRLDAEIALEISRKVSRCFIKD